MVKRTLTLTALATVLMAAPAMAQTSTAPAGSMNSTTTGTQVQSTAASPAGAMGNVQYITQNRSDLWRASKLDGVDVYNDRNEKIGDISEVLVDREGKVEAVVIGVGGFLGVGEHDVAVPFTALHSQMNDPNRTAANVNAPATSTTAANTAPPAATTTSPTATGTVTAPAANTNARAAATDNDMRNYPERAILAGATKEQLKSVPEFKYNR
jgi:sporulation protein YlmC with PRC-barrel domain